jgi:hypothetical protein
MTPPPPSERLCILVPVYYPYRWLAPLMQKCLDDFWQEHPPIFYCGLQPGEAGGLPVLPLRDTTLPRDWPAFVRDAVEQLITRGFDKCYLLLEEHLPLEKCHSHHLNASLPSLMDALDGAYIGLMGWDNRRFSTRAPILGPDAHRMMHLTTPDAPRFHLHPSLWRLAALRDCLDLTLREPVHTPWRFEKVCDRPDAALPELWKKGCYLVSSRTLGNTPLSGWQILAGWLERFVFHKLMALHPLLPGKRIGQAFWRVVGFDDFFYRGPYPMFFSGVMAKGKLNPYFVNYIQNHPRHASLWEAILSASEERLSPAAHAA